MRKRWILVSALAGALALTALGGTVLAQTADDDDAPSLTIAAGHSDLLARVAEIVGVDEQSLRDAFEQAAREKRDGALEAFLDAQVEAGRLTEAEAQEIREWIEARPEGLRQLPRTHRLPRFHGPSDIGPRFNFRFGGDLDETFGNIEERMEELRERFGRAEGGFRFFGPGFHFEFDGTDDADDDDLAEGASA